MIAPANRCPACHGNAPHILNWPFSGLGESIFNTHAAFHSCPVCGLVYAANWDDKTLEHFYTGECAYFNSDHFDVNSRENIEKYIAYRQLLIEAGLTDRDILDVGCGRGGFLRWLKQHDWQGTCNGVDADPRSIPHEQAVAEQVCFSQGNAFNIPAQDASQGVLTYFHVLEHLRDLDSALAEATRALKDNGYLMIEVPDAECYAQFPIGTAFWFGIREHVNHFSLAALERLLSRHNLLIRKIRRGILPTPEFSYPSLLLLAQKSNITTHTAPTTNVTNPSISDFLNHSLTAQAAQAEWVRNTMVRYERSVFWGCSAQLFSLLPHLDLGKIELCDSSPAKQCSNYRGLPVQTPSSIHPEDKALFIAPYLHRSAIKKAAVDIGWNETNIFSLE